MIEKSTIERVEEHFFTYPTTVIHLRELSRQLKLSMPTILAAIKKLEKEQLISIDRSGPLTLVRANHTSQFIRRKRVYNLQTLYESGIVDELLKSYPQAIVCFGSYSRGEDTERSDIDIAVIGSPANISGKYEAKLKRRISIHNPRNMSEEFKSNLANGIVLEGAM